VEKEAVVTDQEFIIGTCFSMYQECRAGQGSGAVGNPENYITDFERLLRREVGRSKIADLTEEDRRLFAQLLTEHKLYPPWRY
jgi:hypothetical protein